METNETRPESRLKDFIYRHPRLATIYEWLVENWLLTVIYLLAAAVFFCLINLAVVACNDW